MKKLRLLLFEKCNRNCFGCCNKDWDLSKLEVENDFSKYEIIMLTGGEPLLAPNYVLKIIDKIRKVSSAKIYVYTAKTNKPRDILKVLNSSDGLTVTLHDQADVSAFISLNTFLCAADLTKKSMRLNIFKGINISRCFLHQWKVKENIEWIKNSPLPKDEEFKKL